MTAARRALPLMLLICGIWACRSTPESAEIPDVPDGVRVDVEIDGRDAAPITSSELRVAVPDYHDVDHRAWRLATLLQTRALKPGMQLDVEESNGTRTIFAGLGDAAVHSEPVLMVNRKGQVLIALIERDNPFPAFHGRGGNRGQGGTKANRIRSVTKLRLTSR